MHQPIPLVARIDNSQSVFYHFSGQKWSWYPECAKAFQDSKQALVNSPALVLYDGIFTLSLQSVALWCGGSSVTV